MEWIEDNPIDDDDNDDDDDDDTFVLPENRGRTTTTLTATTTATTDDVNDRAKRKLVYSAADSRMNIQTIVKHYIREWESFLCEYLRTNSTETLPDNWSPSEVFPCVNMATIGDAGTGKTTSMREYHATQPGVTITAPVNKASNSYIVELESVTQPSAWSHMLPSNTWYKLLGIKFSSPLVQQMLKDIKNNENLKTSFERVLSDTSVCVDVEATSELIRDHTRIILEVLHPLVVDMVERRMTDFRNGGYRYRLYTTSEQHICYAPPFLPTNLFSSIGEYESVQRYLAATTNKAGNGGDDERTVTCTNSLRTAMNKIRNLNNYTSDEWKSILDKMTGKDVKYCVIGEEVGESGTLHLQGYVRFTKDQRMTSVKKMTDWLTSRQAPVHGELSIYDNYKMDSHTHDSTLPYDVRDVYYKDVHNGTLVGSNRDGNSSLLHGICGQIGLTTSRECITCDCPRDGSLDTIKKRHHEEQQQQQQQPQNDYVDIHKDETKDRLLSNP